MALDPSSRERFNLSNTAVLLFDPKPIGMAILGQIMKGLGAKRIYKCASIEEAKEVIRDYELDLMIVDGVSETGEGYEFVKWLRFEVPEPNKHVPVLLTTGHTLASDVKKARDCGGNFILAKPLAPIVVLERIVWIAKEGRAFLFSENYVGPDRRFRNVELPEGQTGRRLEDRRRAEAEAAADNDPSSDPAAGDPPQKAAS